MIRTLSTAATGLQAQQANIDRISNDLSNVNTDGYKRGRTEFQELMYETTKEPGAPTGNGSVAPIGVQNGLGVKVGGSHKIFEQGIAKSTAHPFDLMIEGQGFFPVSNPATGEVFYTRVGAFHKDAQGKMQLGNGFRLVPEINIPPGVGKVEITPRGEVRVMTSAGEETVVGNIQLVDFQNDQGLLAAGSGLYKATAASGNPIQGVPGENGMGTLQQEALEGSNVNVPSAMVDMIATQRAYEMNTRVMGVADKMLEATINLK
jgi:flagellar basal-body rod protein FlgG